MVRCMNLLEAGSPIYRHLCREINCYERKQPCSCNINTSLACIVPPPSLPPPPATAAPTQSAAV